MPEGNTVEIALQNFTVNKAEAERQLAAQQAQLGKHEHGRLCFSWRRCRKLGASIVELSERLPKYDAAIEGLQSGDYRPAVAFLDEIAPTLDETGPEVVARIRRDSHLDVMTSLQRSPTFIQAGIIRLRDELAALIPPDAPTA